MSHDSHHAPEEYMIMRAENVARLEDDDDALIAQLRARISELERENDSLNIRFERLKRQVA